MKVKITNKRFCYAKKALVKDPGLTHVCFKPKGHKGKHSCSAAIGCNYSWVNKKAKV